MTKVRHGLLHSEATEWPALLQAIKTRCTSRHRKPIPTKNPQTATAILLAGRVSIQPEAVSIRGKIRSCSTPIIRIACISEAVEYCGVIMTFHPFPLIPIQTQLLSAGTASRRPGFHPTQHPDPTTGSRLSASRRIRRIAYITEPATDSSSASIMPILEILPRRQLELGRGFRMAASLVLLPSIRITPTA